MINDTRGAEIRFNVSSDEIALMTDEELASAIMSLNEALANVRKNDLKSEKKVEMELSWYIRENQIREVRRVANEKWLRTSVYVSE